MRVHFAPEGMPGGSSRDIVLFQAVQPLLVRVCFGGMTHDVVEQPQQSFVVVCTECLNTPSDRLQTLEFLRGLSLQAGDFFVCGFDKFPQDFLFNR
jgi:hypothetical protein